MLSVRRAKNGLRILLYDGKPLNSTYDPLSEARSFVSKHVDRPNPAVVIIVGEALGYLRDAMTAAFPRARIVAVFLHRDLKSFNAAVDDNDHFPDEPDFPESITRDIDERNVGSLVILQWGPSLRAWPTTAAIVLERIRAAVRRATGNVTTTAAFGRKWLSNLVENFLDLPPVVTLPQPSRPILIVASGPSAEQVLDSSFPVERFDVWALPSSIGFLAERDITPTVIVTTDPGMYASLHYRAFRRFPDSILALPLTAFPGAIRHADRVALLDQQTRFENELFSGANLPRVVVPSNGTVGGTALELALLFGLPVFLVGLDLSTRFDVEHARPHPFVDLDLASTSRLMPFESRNFRRIRDRYPVIVEPGVRTNAPLATYADWFRHKLRALPPGRVFRYGPAPVDLGPCRSADSADALRHLASAEPVDVCARSVSSPTPPFEDRIVCIRNVLLRFRRDVSEVKRLSTGSSSNTSGEILAYLLGTRYYLDAHRRGEQSGDEATALALDRSCDAALREIDRNLLRTAAIES